MYSPDVCIYHSSCQDGFTAALAIWSKWPNIEFYGASHGDPIDLEHIRGKNVLFVDFSLKKDKIWAMAQFAKSVVILDHHKSAEAELADFGTFNGKLSDLEHLLNYEHNNVVTHFDMMCSGAVLAWQFAFENHEYVPYSYQLVEDRDLWNWKYDDTKPFTLALSFVPPVFETWEKIMFSRDAIEGLVIQGEAVLEYQQVLINQIVKNAYWSTKFEGHKVIECNTPVLQSEVGNALIKAHPDADFAAVWYISEKNATKYSLRSEDGRADVSVIAAQYGGGGHRNASGFIMED